MSRMKVVVYTETNRKEFSTGMKRLEDAVKELNDYVESKYGGKKK